MIKFIIIKQYCGCTHIGINVLASSDKNLVGSFRRSIVVYRQIYAKIIFYMLCNSSGVLILAVFTTAFIND